MILRDLFLRIRALVMPHRVERELDEELAFHIERETQKHIAAGLTADDARTRARARFGPVPLAADQCRDARGTGLVDDVGRDVLYAWRTFRRAPLAALTIVATVALGLGLVTAVFTIYALFMLRTDAVRNPGELFSVGMEQVTGPGSDADRRFTLSDYDALRRETSVFTDAVAMQGFASGRVDGRLMRAAYVTGNFFQMLGIRPVLGRPLLPADDQRFAGQPVIVLSHAGWHRLFDGDPAVVGRRLTINRVPCEVVGVMPDGFRGLGITPPDYWAPLALVEQFGADDESQRQGTEIAVEIVGRLKPSLSRQAAAAALTTWASGRPEFSTVPGRQIRVFLAPRQGTLAFGNSEALVLFSPLFFAFGLILTIGCANVANLLLARGVSRQREIGIRLSLGASRRRIVRQLLTESLLLALAAAVCGLAVSRLVLEGLLYAAITTIPPDFADLMSVLNLAAPGSDWRVLVFLTVGAIASTMFFGLAPALQATRLELVPTMRGEVTSNARPRRTRHGLIAIQVGASALLLICAAVFLRGALAAAAKDAGVRTIDTLSVNIDAEKRRPEVLDELRAEPLVAVIAASSPSTRGVMRTSAAASGVEVEQRGVSANYFDVLGFELVSGRSFTPAERTPDSGVVIVADTVARQQWPKGDAVGQVLSLEAPPRALTVVGVVRDRERTIYLPTAPETAGTNLTLRVRGTPDQARRALLGRLPGLDPAFGLMTVRTLTGMPTYLLQSAFWVTIVLGGLALVLTVSGLFSVLSYLVEQQAKEIGVRMALGAATKHVAGLVLTQSIRPVGIGLAAGSGLAAALATVLMASPEAAQIRESVDVFDPVAYTASALVIATASLIAISVPTVRAARIDPIATLRKD